MDKESSLKANFIKNLAAFKKPYKVQFGTGSKKLNGWVNSDERGPFKWIINNDPLPFESNSCSLIYHEHLLEHLTTSVALSFVKESYRILQKGGILRIAQPDLDDIIEAAYNGGWNDPKRYPGSIRLKLRKAQMINMSFHAWGHKFLYNKEELVLLFKAAGFVQIRTPKIFTSQEPLLRKLETRGTSLLICEGIK